MQDKESNKNQFRREFLRENLDINLLIKNENRIKPIKLNDFGKFLKIFIGTNIHRGKKAYSIKILNYIFLNLKKIIKKDPTKILFIIIKNLSPFITVGKRSFKKKINLIPLLTNDRKKNFLMSNWLIRQYKNKSNVSGVKKEDILKSMVDTFLLKGSAINLKKDHFLEAKKVRGNMVRNPFHFKLMKTLTKLDDAENLKNFEKNFYFKHEMSKSDIYWFNLRKNFLYKSNKAIKDFIKLKKENNKVKKEIIQSQKENANFKRKLKKKYGW